MVTLSSRYRPDRAYRDCVALLALLVAMRATTALAEPPACALGKAHWQARRYEAAEASLLACRDQPYGRTLEVDFMLGTAGCRIKAERAWGGKMLRHALQHYQMTRATRETIARELALCLKPEPMPVLAASGVELGVMASAGAMARGKMYYATRQDEPVAAYTARPLGPVDRAAMQARLTPLGSAEDVAVKLQPLAQEGMRVVVAGRFAFVSAQSARQLKAIATQLERYLSFLERSFGVVRPDSYMTLYLVKTQWELRMLARSLHQLDVSPATIGYTYQDDLSAVAVIPGAKIGTLKHELFHLLARSSFGDIPQWLDEGIAALYEVSQAKGDAFTGQDNWRGPVLADAWSERPTLAEVIEQSWFVNDRASESGRESGPWQTESVIKLHFAVARYFALWLQDKNQLLPVYQALRALPPGKTDQPAAAERAAVEGVIGPLDLAQGSFDAWFSATHRVNGVPPALLSAGAAPP